MNKVIAVCLLVFTLSIFGTVSCGFIAPGGDCKNTGPVTVRRSSGSAYEFIRPNQEVFEMLFEPESLFPHFASGTVLKDLVYSDEKDHRAFFIKAVLESEPPASTVKMLYETPSAMLTCSSSGPCSIEQPAPNAYYLWKDGGYRDHPEKATP